MDKEAQSYIKDSDDHLLSGELKIIPPKDIDLVVKTQFLKILSWPMAAITLILKIALGYSFITSLLIALLISIPIAYVILFIVNNLFSIGKKANWSLTEQHKGDLLRVKYFKRKNDFDSALKIVNTVLERQPDHKEALLIKAEILWEGFKNYGGAKVCLKEIIDMNSSEDEHINQWAKTLFDKITSQMKNNYK